LQKQILLSPFNKNCQFSYLLKYSYGFLLLFLVKNSIVLFFIERLTLFLLHWIKCSLNTLFLNLMMYGIVSV
jgi:hypothetical protein